MRINKITLTVGIAISIYLVVDVFHFFVYRIIPTYPTLTEAFYESTIISVTKWLLCITTLIGIFLERKNKSISFSLLIVSAIGILALFILKGQLYHLIRGSVVFKIGLLEITMFLVFIRSILFQSKKFKIGNIILSILLGIILGYIIYYFPVYNLP